MLTRRTYWLCLSISMALAFVAWAGFVPEWVSGATFGWLAVVVIALVAVSLLTVRAGQPTRSLLQRLSDDAEYQKEQGR